MSLKPGMTTPQVLQCPDRHFRHIIFEIGPYIADYPEQVLISGIVQNWCGRFLQFSCSLTLVLILPCIDALHFQITLTMEVHHECRN